MTENDSNGFILFRKDDKGNDFVVDTFRTQDEADKAQERFEKRGHKQTYWVESMENLLRKAEVICMTDEDKERQRRSFTYGNAHIDNPMVTRELIEQVADEMKGRRGDQTETEK